MLRFTALPSYTPPPHAHSHTEESNLLPRAWYSVPEEALPEVAHLVDSCLSQDPRLRPSAIEIVRLLEAMQ